MILPISYPNWRVSDMCRVVVVSVMEDGKYNVKNT